LAEPKKLKLAKPLVVTPATAGSVAVTVDEIAFDFEKLTGADYLFCEREHAAAAALQVSPVELRLESGFQLQIAAQASGIGVERLKTLGLTDFGAVLGTVRDFLLTGA
jgi:hypothetical protein